MRLLETAEPRGGRAANRKVCLLTVHTRTLFDNKTAFIGPYLHVHTGTSRNDIGVPLTKSRWMLYRRAGSEIYSHRS